MGLSGFDTTLLNMEYLQNGITLELADGSFPLSTDSVALGAFVKLPKNAQVLDLCAGCGTLGLMLCAKDQSCHVTGIEINPSDHEMALHNIAANGLTDRMESICGDACGLCPAPGRYHIVLSNPPYFSGGPMSTAARRDDLCPPEQLFKAAAKALRYGGDFYLVHRPELLGHLCGLGAQNGLEAKELCLLRHRESGPLSLILLKLRKGGKPGLRITEQALYGQDNAPTEYSKSIYHTGA